MNTLKGKNIFLRALEPTDLDFLYQVENDQRLWEVSNTSTPYSRYILEQYLQNSYRDIYEVKQLRLVICRTDDASSIGLIDLYDYDPKNRRVGVGIVIYSHADKRKGFASESLQLVCDYAFENLMVHQVFAGITEDNKASITLFEKAGFQKNGRKKDWIFARETYKDEFIYQRFH